MNSEPRAPTFSVLLPFRDAEATLAACLRSVRRQTRDDWECVAVDDGSTDRGASIATRFSAIDRRIRLVRPGAVGLVPALNAGLARCRAPWVARIDADDLMHRRRLEQQGRALAADPGLAGVGAHVRLFPRAAVGPGDRAYERWLNGIVSPEQVERDAFVECPLAHPSWTFRRALLVELGYRDRGWPEDYDLLLRALRRGDRLGVVPERLLGWRHGPERLSRTSPRYGADRFIACKAHHLARSFLAATDRYLLWGYGGTGRRLAEQLGRQGRRPAGLIEVHPGRLGNRILEAPVVAPDEIDRLDRLPLVVSVAGEEPRRRIRAFLEARGRVERVDFICAA